MEREEKKQQEQRPQYFYFSEDGKLVVESNKGVWVDGVQYVKMYGNFTCNAKTIGMIIAQLKGVRVAVGKEISVRGGTYGYYTESKVAIVNPTQVEEAIRQEAEVKIKKSEEEINKIIEKINAYNALPWYKRMFKQVVL